MYISVIIPTYNRLPILQKCLLALEAQNIDDNLIDGYEIILVDDGSTDNTLEWLDTHLSQFPHLKIYQQNHQGPAAARNLGIEQSQGEIIIFIDSDLVVTANFLIAHAQALITGTQKNKSDRVFTYGWVINTCNFANPTSESYKITDFSAAYFATGNVAIAKKWLLEAGKFDTQFQLYGWEDLELGVRLKKLNVPKQLVIIGILLLI
jgi:glycosyltransferase involved in cell wall biosynthesis